MIKFSFSCTFLCACVCIAFSQNTTPAEYLKYFPESKVVFDEYRSTYEYIWDDANGELRVKEEERVEIMAVKLVEDFTWPIFYNDQITVGQVDVKTKLGKAVKYVKYCGHHSQSGIFHSDARMCTFDFSLATLGEKIILSTVQTYLDPRYFTKIPLQSFLPGRKRIVDIYWPEWVEVDFRNFHFEGANIEITDISESGKKGIRYQVNWPNAIPDEESNPHFSQYIPHIIPLSKAYTAPGKAERSVLIESTDHLYTWYRELMTDMKNDSESLRELVYSITKGLTNDEQIRAIYYWVQDNIQYLAFENGIMGFQPDNAHDVLYKRYGDCKGMSNLLKEMLILAGFDARLTWLGTSMLPYTYDLPSLSVDNHMICTVVEDDGVRILDPTVKFNQLGYNPYHIQGKQLMIEEGPTYRIYTVPIMSFDQNFEQFRLEASISNDVLIGKGLLTFDGDAKQFFLNALNNLDKKDHNKFIRYITAQDANPDDFEIELAKAHRDSVVHIGVKNHLRNRVSSYGDELFVELDFRREFEAMKMKKNRKSPYDFERRRFITSEVSMHIPEGYTLKHLPAALTIDGTDFRFNLNYQLKEGMVVYTKELEINTAILRQSSFGKWNEAIDQLTKFYKEPLIFKKHVE